MVDWTSYFVTMNGGTPDFRICFPSLDLRTLNMCAIIPFRRFEMLVQDIVKFFLVLVFIAAVGSAANKDLCTYYGDTDVMQSDWADCE